MRTPVVKIQTTPVCDDWTIDAQLEVGTKQITKQKIPTNRAVSWFVPRRFGKTHLPRMTLKAELLLVLSISTLPFCVCCLWLYSLVPLDQFSRQQWVGPKEN